MTPLSFVLVAVGIGMLYLGGEGLIKGAVDLARTLGLSRTVIGLTVVAFATSSPELAATLTASLTGSPDVAVGNVIGSNIANVGLILALAAMIFPLQSSLRFVQREVPVMLVITIALYPILLDLKVSRLEGAGLVAALGVYLWFLMRDPKEPEIPGLDEAPPMSLGKSLLIVAVGIGFLVGGAWCLIEGAVAIARAIGVPERVVGLTMVAFGTSLPELASSIAAARHRHGDIVLGNIIGSNVFNLLCILGITALARPIPVSATVLRVDFWVMLAFSIVVLPFHWPDLKLTRPKGAVLVATYLAYVVFLFY